MRKKVYVKNQSNIETLSIMGYVSDSWSLTPMDGLGITRVMDIKLMT